MIHFARAKKFSRGRRRANLNIQKQGFNFNLKSSCSLLCFLLLLLFLDSILGFSRNILLNFYGTKLYVKYYEKIFLINFLTLNVTRSLFVMAMSVQLIVIGQKMKDLMYNSNFKSKMKMFFFEKMTKFPNRDVLKKCQ
jgi:hypothetical protein